MSTTATRALAWGEHFNARLAEATVTAGDQRGLSRQIDLHNMSRQVAIGRRTYVILSSGSRKGRSVAPLSPVPNRQCFGQLKSSAPLEDVLESDVHGAESRVR